MAISLALGRPPGGTSLDNTVRIVLEEPTDDWILLDIEAEGMHRSIGLGRVRLWRRDGTLIGVGTQSCIIRTNLAIGLATARIVRAIAHDEQAVLPVSVRTEVDGVGEVCLSLPAVVGRRGVRSLLAVPMDATEQAGLRASAAIIRRALDTVS